MSETTGTRASLISPAASRLAEHSGQHAQSLLDPAICWQAIYSRDRRFDGRFFAAATSTGLYCRSTCPVPFARPTNIVLFPCAAAAEAAGFKPCRRCHPQASPGTPAWLGTSAIVSRALRLIWEGALDTKGVEELAERVGIGSRHMRRLFIQHLGASPAQIAGTHRVHFARKLIDETDLPMTQVAASAGFRSIRQFNHAVKGAVGHAPTELRRSRDRVETAPHQKGLVIRLPYRPPLNWSALIRFLYQRATFGVEFVSDNCYRRTIETGGMTGIFSVRPDTAESRLIVCIELPDYQFLMPIVERIKRIFDLGADPLYIASGLSKNPQMASVIESHAGLRVPGVWDGFELAVKAILGEGLGRSSRSLIRKMVSALGRPIDVPTKGLTHLFPRPDVLAKADLRDEIGIGVGQAAAIRTLATSASKGHMTFEAPITLEDTVCRLSVIPNLTRNAAQYIAMRAFGEPDAFPVEPSMADRFLARIGTSCGPDERSRIIANWRPWRAYAAMHIWAADKGRRSPVVSSRAAPAKRPKGAQAGPHTARANMLRMS